MRKLTILPLLLVVCAIAAFGQTVNLTPWLRATFFDGSGRPLAGGRISFYAAGTSTPQPTYSDSSGLVANSNPVILDAAGRAAIWLSVGVAYKVVVQDQNFVTQYSEDNFSAPSSGDGHIFRVIPMGGTVGELRFLGSIGTNYVGFKAPDGISSSVIWTLPGADGVSGSCLTTDGGGTLAWSTSCGGGGGSGFVTLATSQVITGGKTFNQTINFNTSPNPAMRPVTTGTMNIGAGPAHFATIFVDTTSSHFLYALPLSGGIGELRLGDLTGTVFAGFKAPDALGGDLIWTLPTSDGTPNQCLQTNGSGILSFSACGGGGGGGNPFSDANPLIFNDSDSSKQLIVSAANLSSGNTRTLSAQDGDYSIAGEDINNHFTGVQSFGSATLGGPAAVTITPAAIRPASNGAYNLGATGAHFGTSFIDTMTSSAVRMLSLSGAVGEVDFYDLTGASWVGFKASSSFFGSVVWTLPSADGNIGDCLHTNGATFLSWSACGGGGGGGSPGGSDGQVQFNSAGNFGASPSLTWNNSTRLFNVATSPGTAGMSVQGGFITSDQGFLASPVSATSYNAINAISGGAAVRSVTATAYVQVGNGASDPTPTTSDSFHAGTLYYSTSSSCLKVYSGSTFSCISGGGGGGGSAAGSDGQIQFNTSGSLNASANFTWSNLLRLLNVSTAPGLAGVNVQGGFISSDQGFLASPSSATSYNAINAVSGGAAVRSVTATAYVQVGNGVSNPTATANDSFHAGTLYYNTSSACLEVYNGSSFSCVTGGGGGGVTSLNGLAGGLTINGTSGQVNVSPAGSTITLSLPQSIATNSNVNFASLTTTGGGVVQSSASGASIAFQTTNFNYQVDGSGNISAFGQINLTGGASAYKMGGTTVINTARQFVGNGMDVGANGVSAGGYNVFGGFLGQTWNVDIAGGFTIAGTGCAGGCTTLVYRGGILVSAF